ncbi:MAG: hypothetical protein MUD08_01525 [Cytophagales bacterium]|jgi:hypothetical protein|nr:hypothetical protein [Cytophagales bacterium]
MQKPYPFLRAGRMLPILAACLLLCMAAPGIRAQTPVIVSPANGALIPTSGTVV